MTATASPEMVTTRAGVPLPVVALPQGELLTVSLADIPLLKNALGPGLSFHPLRLDTERSEYVILARMAPGVGLQIHYHTGPAQVYTLAGRWMYVEYPDQPQTAGSYLYEPGGSVHTFMTPADNTEDTVALIWVSGANVNFNEDGTFHSVLDTVSLQYLAEAVSAAQGTSLSYIGGGAAGVVKS
ncbi:2,4'-dihydroxyacetophenone dioxygenase family protein [Smaragdicoccus niigatensis]|uniref:2,4'-dihydroxyacetophenone dioxygenase family protein n=1 Tax=Smaragdicoccus niigatensis TaxID=359359 RepID=UPI000376A9A5|nr:2,4'-dihydroxyacetophenone dioxygenase family protein [Smaragdicoccus niigatensis]